MDTDTHTAATHSAAPVWASGGNGQSAYTDYRWECECGHRYGNATPADGDVTAQHAAHLAEVAPAAALDTDAAARAAATLTTATDMIDLYGARVRDAVAAALTEGGRTTTVDEFHAAYARVYDAAWPGFLAILDGIRPGLAARVTAQYVREFESA